MILLLLLIATAICCSDFQIRAKDDSLIYGRAMDFPIPLKSQLVVFNREYQHCSHDPDGRESICWTSKYGFVGINAFNVPLITEGMNEKGLTCGYLVMNDSIYPSVDPNYYNQSLAITDFCMWVLSSFDNVYQVVNALDNVHIWGDKVPILNILMKLHIPIHDAMGNNLVIEFIDGKVTLYDNQLGILTNEPPLDYQLINLGSYNLLTSVSPEPVIINGKTITPIPGSGLDSMSGGWSPVARFVRIATLLRYITEINTAQDAVTAASWILNSVFVPNGIEIGKFENVKVTVTTQWGVIKDVTNMKFYFRSDDCVLRYVNLHKIDFSNNTNHNSYSVRQPPFSIDITSII